MELRWDNKYQASTPLSFSPVALRDVSELAVFIAKQTSVCVRERLLLTKYHKKGGSSSPCRSWMGSLRFNVSLGLYFCIDNPSYLALVQLLLT